MLIPPDTERCQVIDYNPFRLGGDMEIRCANKPKYILRDSIPDENGEYGSQSVCESCRNKWADKLPANYYYGEVL